LIWRALRLTLAAAALAAGIGATTAHAQPVSTPIGEVVNSAEVRREGDSLRHIPSNYLFPASLGGMPARKLVVYEPGNVSVQYTLRGGANGDGWIDLYVYPKAVGLTEEAAELEALLVEHYHGEAIAPPTGFAHPEGGIASGWYTAKMGDQDYLTHYQLSQHGTWSVKARFSMPRDAAPDVRERAAAALAEGPTRWR
jgi:hypothetical protein